MSSTIKVNNIQNLAGDDSGFDLSTNDKIGMKIANSEVVTVDTTGVVFNENSADRDFRVESDGNTHGFFLEGSTGNVGIGTSSPDAQGGNQNIIFNIEGSDNIAYVSVGSGGNAVDDGFAIEGVATGVTSGDKRLGQIGMFRTNTSTTSLNSQMAFYTTDSGTHAERMRLGDGGNLLIGRTSVGATGNGHSI